MAAVDSEIPSPVREVDKPFLMPIEDVFTITGRGTVATGRIERGVINVGEQVDIVGQAWFFQQNWLHYLWECEPDYVQMFQVGEDIGLSYIFQKHGINTYVPPHPLNNRNVWGSDKDLAQQYGTEVTSVSCQPDIGNKFDKAFKYYINKGFMTIRNREPEKKPERKHPERISMLFMN